MTSTFSWLDYSEQDRQVMLDVLDTLKQVSDEQDTRDELGIGTIRDTLAEMFFPGINTIQTRARYFLFIPWIYLDLEGKKVPSSGVAHRLRNAEEALIAPLKATKEKGVFGAEAGGRLQRPPSSIYWHGLGRWGIRAVSGAQTDYHRGLDKFYRRVQQSVDVQRDGWEECEGPTRNWHPGLPKAPPEFPRGATFHLSLDEAEYLRERILSKARGTLLAHLVDHPESSLDMKFVWELPQTVDMPQSVQEQIAHAHGFSATMYGAALLYNLMLAEASGSTRKCDDYRQRILDWSSSLDMRRHSLLGANRNAFWTTVLSANPQISAATKVFVDRWLELIRLPGAAARIADSNATRSLIADREYRLKHSQARLRNQSALKLWSGAAGLTPLSFRWRNAKTIVNDIHQGLHRDKSHA